MIVCTKWGSVPTQKSITAEQNIRSNGPGIVLVDSKNALSTILTEDHHNIKGQILLVNTDKKHGLCVNRRCYWLLSPEVVALPAKESRYARYRKLREISATQNVIHQAISLIYEVSETLNESSATSILQNPTSSKIFFIHKLDGTRRRRA